MYKLTMSLLTVRLRTATIDKLLSIVLQPPFSQEDIVGNVGFSSRLKMYTTRRLPVTMSGNGFE